MLKYLKEHYDWMLLLVSLVFNVMAKSLSRLSRICHPWGFLENSAVARKSWINCHYHCAILFVRSVTMGAILCHLVNSSFMCVALIFWKQILNIRAKESVLDYRCYECQEELVGQLIWWDEEGNKEKCHRSTYKHIGILGTLSSGCRTPFISMHSFANIHINAKLLTDSIFY